MKKKCEMCGVEKENIGEAIYANFKQKICKECLVDCIPLYTLVYHKEKVKRIYKEAK